MIKSDITAIALFINELTIYCWKWLNTATTFCKGFIFNVIIRYFFYRCILLSLNWSKNSTIKKNFSKHGVSSCEVISWQSSCVLQPFITLFLFKTDDSFNMEIWKSEKPWNSCVYNFLIFSLSSPTDVVWKQKRMEINFFCTL